MKKTLVLVSVLLSVLVVGCGKQGIDTIKIAAVAPITGAQGEVGQDLINGAKMAVEEKNAQGGILGKRVELLVMDDKADPKEAVSVANNILSNPSIVGVVGHMNSGTMLASSNVYGGSGLPVVMPVPTNPTITKQNFENLFRVPATDSDQGPACADFAINHLGKKRIAVLHDKTAYGQGIAEEFKKKAESLGVKLLLYEGITEGDKDFRAVLTRLMGRDMLPEVLFFGGIYNEGGLIAKQASELRLKMIFLAADGCFGSKFIEIGGKAAEGAIMSFIAPDKESNETTKAFFEKFSAKYGKVVSFAPLGYDAAQVLMKGIQDAGSVDKKAIVAALHQQSFSFNGVTGTISFEQNGDNKNKNLSFYTVKGGSFVIYK
jgi:branched-chain amino acid transport system substrate-binding protein